MRVFDAGPDAPRQDAAFDAAVTHALGVRVAAGELPATLRLYTPAPTVAFGRLDALRDGFARAVAAARSHGFEPMLRTPGGRAAAYDEGTLGFDLATPVADAFAAVQDVFRSSSDALATALRDLGVDARVGRVDGEYCPGDFTVNARGRVKLIGTAQRVVRGASLLGGFLTVDGADRIRAVLDDVYTALGFDWDPLSVGALAAERPGTTPDEARAAVLAALAPGHEGAGRALDEATAALAATLVGRHRVA